MRCSKMAFPLLAAVLAVMSGTVNAANVTFVGENGSGSGSLNVPENWSNTTGPTAGDGITFDRSGDITASSDLAVKTMSLSAGENAVITFALDGHKISSSDAGDTSIKGKNATYIFDHATFAPLRWANVGNDAEGGTKLVFRNGASFESERNFRLGNSTGAGNELQFSGENTKDGHSVTFSTTSYGNVLRVSDFASYTVPANNSVLIGAAGAAGGRNKVVVEGGGDVYARVELYPCRLRYDRR